MSRGKRNKSELDHFTAAAFFSFLTLELNLTSIYSVYASVLCTCNLLESATLTACVISSFVFCIVLF